MIISIISSSVELYIIVIRYRYHDTKSKFEVHNKINVKNRAIMDYHWSNSLADIHFSPLKTIFRNHIIRNTSPLYYSRTSSTVRGLKNIYIYIL